MTSFQTLRTDVSDRVATIWLNRPERRNAFSSVMTRELYEAFALFESAEDVRAIVVTGTGRYFSAGTDLERGGQTFDRPADAAPAATDPAGASSAALRRPRWAWYPGHRLPRTCCPPHWPLSKVKDYPPMLSE